MEISRFPCKRLLRMPGSTTTRGRHVSCDIDTRRVAFCGTENISTPNLSYAALYLACALPCERFTPALAGIPCITRGQCGSLLLHRDGLPPSTFCRSPGAPVHRIRFQNGIEVIVTKILHSSDDMHLPLIAGAKRAVGFPHSPPPRLALCLEPELDQSADSFGTC
jgi:hypothetical protein